MKGKVLYYSKPRESVEKVIGTDGEKQACQIDKKQENPWIMILFLR